jgi:hypothetical protein
MEAVGAGVGGASVSPAYFDLRQSHIFSGGPRKLLPTLLQDGVIWSTQSQRFLLPRELLNVHLIPEAP